MVAEDERVSRSPLSHHTKRVHESGIHVKEPPAYKRGVLSYAIDAFVTIDQLSCSDLFVLRSVRRDTFLEEALSAEGDVDFNDWMGLVSRTGGASVAFALCFKGQARRR